MPLFLALDAGGTKTDYVLASDTHELARVRGGSIKRMKIDAATAAVRIEEALAELVTLSGSSMRQVTRTCIGTAGVTVPLVTDFLREQFSARVSGELLIVGDAEIALDAAFHGAPGILVLAGTGSNVAGRAPDGNLTSAGGWGPALADQGSGQRIGHEALRALFLAHDEGQTSTLLPAIVAVWQLDPADAFNQLVDYSNRIPAPDFSCLTKAVVRCATEGDRVAAAVLRKEGEDLAWLVRLVARRISRPSSAPLRIAFAGSIMESVLEVREALITSVRQEFPTVEALPGVIDPTAGALWRARIGSRS